MITDTSRSGSAWKSFLEVAGGMRLAHVIASTDVGVCKPDQRIFAEAVRRTGVTASEILHVGDSWMWDVEGARGCGMGAALYRGLREHYWGPGNPREDPPAIDPSIPLLDHLSQVRGLLGQGVVERRGLPGPTRSSRSCRNRRPREFFFRPPG